MALPLNKILMRFIRVVCIDGSFLNSIPLCKIYHTLFIHVPVGHLDAMNILSQMFLVDMLSFMLGKYLKFGKTYA